jgi:flagellar biosynthesis/type III secretory pathway chaperone
MINEQLPNLVKMLEEQITLYRHLLEVVRKEKEILVSANLDELNETNRTKEAMLLKIRAIETERIKVASAISGALGLDPENPRLMEIAKYLNDTDADRLRNIHSVLELLLRRVKDFNGQNEVLVQSALENVTGAMNEIRGVIQEKPTYKNKGNVEPGATPAGKLVSREA